MFLVENFISDDSCEKIVSLINKNFQFYIRSESSKKSLKVFDNTSVSEIFECFTSIPEAKKINEIPSMIKSFYGFETNPIEKLYPTFGLYLEGDSLGPHEDISSIGSEEFVTAIFYFNDEYVGGELLVYPRGMKIDEVREAALSDHYLIGGGPVAVVKPRTGSVVFLKSGTFHEVKEISSGKKYICTILMGRK
jgi:Rps23 Pro-64 3,4-dihydroxylase Tpa1-like proline 4-hydroxylase